MSVFNIKNWEYWSSSMFYIPLLPYAFYLAIKARSFGFFSAVNPGIEGSGNGLESKFKTIELLPDYCKPATVYVAKNEKIATVINNISNAKINFPLIIKPDIGFRGLLVKKIGSIEDLSSYLNKYNSINLIIQEYIEFENECGIFYHRLPSEKSGTITSLTLKKYLTVYGNGKSTLLELIHQDKRAQNYLASILEINQPKLTTIYKKGEKIILNVIGNHSKGTQFINGNHLINNDLVNFLNSLNTQIDGWFYGRIDVKYHSFDELLKGENFKILEINGIISEPTHIYDATTGSYFKALKSIKKHWKLIYTIGTTNNKLGIAKYTNLKDFISTYFKYKRYLKEIAKLNAIQ
ncbi:D-alanine--D-alanine ligase [Lutibacter sp.]|uniref:D-alanine--D-alanine ligase n=1 Tax=Lutibacter sp. TaxID=1925666 RepID=UPI00356577BF